MGGGATSSATTAAGVRGSARGTGVSLSGSSITGNAASIRTFKKNLNSRGLGAWARSVKRVSPNKYEFRAGY